MITAKRIFFFFLLFGNLALSAQQAELKLMTEKEITLALAELTPGQQVKFYDSLSNKWRGKDIAQCLLYANKALELAEQIPGSKELAHALFIRSKCYRQMAKYEKALKDLDSALIIYTNLKDEVWVGTIHADYGNIYYKKGDYTTALECYLKALKYAEKTKDNSLLMMSLNNVGNIYFFKEDFDRAISYYLRSYEANKKDGKMEQSALVLDNVALVYTQKGDLHMALMYQMSAVKILEKANSSSLREIYVR